MDTELAYYHLDYVTFFLKRGGDPNAVVDDGGKTLMHFAAENVLSSGPKVMEHLLRKGGNPNINDAKGNTPINLAIKNTSASGPDILKLLQGSSGH